MGGLRDKGSQGIHGQHMGREVVSLGGVGHGELSE